jgi:hypothetical protein
MPSSPGGTLLWIPMCHGSASPITLPASDERGPGKNCPGGCHAACVAREDQGDGETDDA